MKTWAIRVLVAIDQLINAVFGGVLNYALSPTYRFGFPDETLSSVFGKNVRSGNCRVCGLVCWALDKLDPGHCARNVEPDEGDRIP
jgi:hypothetical protein